MVIIWNDDPTWEWRREMHPRGFALVSNIPPDGNYLMLHSIGCSTIRDRPARGKNWTVTYSKVCSKKREDIEAWSQKSFGKQPDICQLCRCERFRDQ